MKYQFPESDKTNAIKRNRTAISIQYGIGLIIIIYISINNWSESGLEFRLPIIIGIVAMPIAWLYFDKKLKTKLTTVYEIQNNELIIFENGEVINQIPIESIRNIKRLANAHKIETSRTTTYILDGIENKDQLIDNLSKKSS